MRGKHPATVSDSRYIAIVPATIAIVVSLVEPIGFLGILLGVVAGAAVGAWVVRSGDGAAEARDSSIQFGAITVFDLTVFGALTGIF
jgi:UPF0716 family protein affecting phage T7 exclusion